MIADSLWPRGYFQNRMLMPILKGVSHRAKKRVDGSARRPVAHDQFEIFKGYQGKRRIGNNYIQKLPFKLLYYCLAAF
jgi:hypothetical protein